ncbi:thermonuclease family protein [Lysobacter korlensis]|uniref:Thermonuclease family protein n=1 Tax=Lysobacter korlensis TaxID=553636 RepID=A0ABV6RQY8_9GAMM
MSQVSDIGRGWVRLIGPGLLCLAASACEGQRWPSAEEAPPPHDDSRVVGRASVIDGDTLEIRDRRIRLWGIDAPESGQQCGHPDGRRWRCGTEAARALADWIGQRNLNCDPRGKSYERLVARCTVNGHDVGEWMVRNGWALEYRRFSKGQYENAQKAAIDAGVGIHEGTFEPPWEYRKRRRERSRQ